MGTIYKLNRSLETLGVEYTYSGAVCTSRENKSELCAHTYTIGIGYNRFYLNKILGAKNSKVREQVFVKVAAGMLSGLVGEKYCFSFLCQLGRS